MISNESPLMVIGHKNPDTDSICSAIAYAHYKREIAGVPADPFRAGNLNPQTCFVLDHFGVDHPELLTSLLPKLSDIMIKGQDLITLGEDDTLGEALEIIGERRFAFLPVTSEEGTYAGKISALRLAGLTCELGDLCLQPDLSIRFQHFVGLIEGQVLSGEVPEVFQGRLLLPGIAATPPTAWPCSPSSRTALNQAWPRLATVEPG